MKSAALSVLLLGCAPDMGAPAPAEAARAPAPASADGAVLRVDELAIRAEDVDPLARDVRLLYPEYAEAHARRLALTNEILARFAARARHPEAWRQAADACAAADLERLEPWLVEGNWRELGLSTWSAAHALPLATWSEPVELVGRWARLRVDARDGAEDPRKERLSLSVLEFPFLPRDGATALVEEAIDSVRLTVVDPRWDATVPETWKHRMRGADPLLR